MAALALVACSTFARADGLFVDEAAARGISYVVDQGAFGGGWQYGCGVAMCDLDADGDEDIVCMGSSRDPIALWENVGGGHFANRTATAGLGTPSKPSGIAAADYDADGDLDLCVTRWLGPARLFRNDGGLHFTDVTSAAGIVTSGIAAGTGASWADYDGDGYVDLAIANRTQIGAPVKNRLFRNLGNGTFVDVAAMAGVEDGMPSFQPSWCDVDQDGDLDLYVATDKGAPGVSWNRFFRNKGDGTFVEDLSANLSISIDAMGVCYADLDDDMRPEIYVANVPTGNVLFHSADGLAFGIVTAAAGVAAFATCWGGIGFDPDLDGDTDLFVTSSSSGPDFLFERAGSWPMVEKAGAWGLANPGESYCHAVGDVDGDGDPDLLVQRRDAPVRLFINQADALGTRRWATFRGVGRGHDRDAIGLQVEVVAGAARAWRQVECGSAYKSQSSLVLHVGLGGADVMDSVVARWPNGGGTRTLAGYAARERWTLWPNELLGDVDRDGTLGAADWAAFRTCLGATFGPGCEQHDFDGDADVDEADQALFLARACDLDGDGAVAGDDLAILLGSWGAGAGAAGELDGDGSVGAGDLALLLLAWTG